MDWFNLSPLGKIDLSRIQMKSLLSSEKVEVTVDGGRYARKANWLSIEIRSFCGARSLRKKTSLLEREKTRGTKRLNAE